LGYWGKEQRGSKRGLTHVLGWERKQTSQRWENFILKREGGEERRDILFPAQLKKNEHAWTFAIAGKGRGGVPSSVSN